MQLTYKGAKHGIYHHGSEDKNQLMAEVPNSIRSAYRQTTERDRKGRVDVKAVHKFTGPANLRGKKIAMVTVVRGTNMGVFYYDHYPMKD